MQDVNIKRMYVLQFSLFTFFTFVTITFYIFNPLAGTGFHKTLLSKTLIYKKIQPQTFKQ